jgi:hypothetical protein
MHKFSGVLARVVAVTLSLFVAADLGRATSIVVDVTSDGIIVVADTAQKIRAALHREMTSVRSLFGDQI